MCTVTESFSFILSTVQCTVFQFRVKYTGQGRAKTITGTGIVNIVASVADPASGAFLTPGSGSGIKDKFFPNPNP
jgi:hypothetical protein